MSKKTPIKFWIVELYDPEAEMDYEQSDNKETLYFRTEKEARKAMTEHTEKYMPAKDNHVLDTLWNTYRQWTPFDPQTGEPNKKPDEPPKHDTLPLYKWEEEEKQIGTVFNSLAESIGYDNLSRTYNETTWGGGFFACARPHIIE